MDFFLEKFQSQFYCGGFYEDQWEEEFEKVFLFMKRVLLEIDFRENFDLVCFQLIIFDEECFLEEQVKIYKDEGNDYFKEKDYKKVVILYIEGLKKKCVDFDLNVVFYINWVVVQYYLGNFCFVFNDVIVVRKLKFCYFKVIIRGVLCYLELKYFVEVMNWCDEGL